MYECDRCYRSIYQFTRTYFCDIFISCNKIGKSKYKDLHHNSIDPRYRLNCCKYKNLTIQIVYEARRYIYINVSIDIVFRPIRTHQYGSNDSKKSTLTI